MTIASAIAAKQQQVAAAYTAISNKGGTLPATRNMENMPTAINSIQTGGGSSGWQPNPDWWDIKTILQNDTRTYAGKAIILYSNSDDFTALTISSPLVAIATSDGSFYTSSTTHTWDRSKDKIVTSDISDTTPKYGTRYLILYFNTADVTYTAINSFKVGDIYAIFGCNLVKNSSSAIANASFFYSNYSLQAFDFLQGYNFVFGTSAETFCYGCWSLQKLPDNLDTSNVTNFTGFCQICYALPLLPDNLDTSSGTIFNNFCRTCYSLEKLPDNLDTSKGTNFTNFCNNALVLRKLPDNLDTSSGTNFSSFCRSCSALEELPQGLDTSKATMFSNFCANCNALQKLSDTFDISRGTSISSLFSQCFCLVKANIKLGTYALSISTCTLISIESFRYIADNAPTVSNKTLTIGSTNIARCGGASGTIITTLTSKGWTVN